MTLSSSTATRDPDQRLAEAFDDLTAAAGHDAAVHVAAVAASELAGAAGLCLLSPAEDRCIVALARTRELYRCDVGRTRFGKTSGQAEFIASPTGERKSVGTTLIVTLRQTSGYTAVVFLWDAADPLDPQLARRLELLAKALGMATQTWRRNEQYAQRLDAQQRLAADLQHRLRNNLALIRSVVRRSYDTAESPEQFALHLEARIGALARMQGALAAAGSAGVELEELVRTELIASAVPEKHYFVQGPAVWLRGKAAESLALVAHELATNSLKYGALAASTGRLAVVWEVTRAEQPRLWLSWSESGVTVATVAPRRRGFGQELLECTLPYELSARTQLTFSPGGVHCTIELPLEPYATAVEQPAQHAHGDAR